jgi:hypothetical protein
MGVIALQVKEFMVGRVALQVKELVVATTI